MSAAERGAGGGQIRVIVDSSSNVPAHLQAQYGMIEVPAIVNFGEESFRNDVDLSIEQFYARFAVSADLPTTSQPPPTLFAAAYRQAFDAGADHLLVVTVSAKLSGTLSSAQIAAQEFGPDRFTMWDTRSASIGSGWQAIEAARLFADGASVDAVLRRLATVRSRMLGFFTVETLKYLARSGRVSNIQAGLGDLLSVKPILRLQHDVLVPVGRVRGRKRSLRELIDRTVAHVGGEPAHLAVGHANALSEAQELAEEVRRAVSVQEMLLVEVGPAIASLTGPGCIGIASYPYDFGVS